METLPRPASSKFYFIFITKAEVSLPTLDIAWLNEAFYGTLPSKVGTENGSDHKPPKV